MTDDEAMKSLKASKTCSLVFVVLYSFDEVPSLFFTPSTRKPRVAVDEIVSLHTIYLKKIPFVSCLFTLFADPSQLFVYFVGQFACKQTADSVTLDVTLRSQVNAKVKQFCQLFVYFTC